MNEQSGAVDSGDGILGWFAGNAVAANLLMAVLLIGGWLTMSQINAEVFPITDPRTISITVPYSGATPEDVEESITRRAEEAVLGIEGIKRVTSRAAEGSGSVSIELTSSADAQAVKK